MTRPNPGDRSVVVTRDFIFLFSAHFLFGLSFWPYVLLPLFLQNLGADLFTVGVVMGIAPLAGIAVRPWVGKALDRIGRRRCLLTGGLIFLSTNLVYLTVHQMGWWIYFVRLFHGLGTGILMASFFTLAADLIPISRRAEGIALFGISGHLSGTIGVLMGEAIVRTGGYSAMFLSGAALSLFSLFFSLSIRERRIDSSGREQADRFVLLLLRPTLRLPLIGTLVFGLSMTSYMVFLKPYVVSSGIGSITPFFISYTLSAVVIRLIGGHWPDRWGMKPVLYPAMGSMALGILVLFLRPTQMGLVLGGVLSGSGHGFLFPILSTMVIGRERTENRGRVMALFTMFYDAGLFIGAPILGLIAEGGGYGAMFSTAAAVLIVSMAGFILFDREPGRLDHVTAVGR